MSILDVDQPEEWARDAARRKKAGVPDQIEFRTKTALALEQTDAALAAESKRSVSGVTD